MLPFHPAYSHHGCVHKPPLPLPPCGRTHRWHQTDDQGSHNTLHCISHPIATVQGILTSNLSLLDQPPDSPLSSTDYTEYNQMLWVATKWNACSNLRKGINNIYFSYCSLLFAILFNPTRIWNNLQVTAATQLKLETHGSFSKLQVTFTFSSFYNVCCYSSACYSSDAQQNQVCFFILSH